MQQQLDYTSALQCDCGSNADRKIERFQCQNGKNQGRFFFKCTPCGGFLWEDEAVKKNNKLTVWKSNNNYNNNNGGGASKESQQYGHPYYRETQPVRLSSNVQQQMPVSNELISLREEVTAVRNDLFLLRGELADLIEYVKDRIV